MKLHKKQNDVMPYSSSDASILAASSSVLSSVSSTALFPAFPSSKLSGSSSLPVERSDYKHQPDVHPITSDSRADNLDFKIPKRELTLKTTHRLHTCRMMSSALAVRCWQMTLNSVLTTRRISWLGRDSKLSSSSVRTSIHSGSSKQ